MYISDLQKVIIMKANKMLHYIKAVLKNMPTDWLKLTTHRLDIFEEKLAKVQFLEQFESLFKDNNADASALNELPTAFDYIRLGHPLSCVLEWAMANLNGINPKNVISFSSKTIAILAILRKNALANKHTQIIYMGALPASLDIEILSSVYGYQFDLKQVETMAAISEIKANSSQSTIFLSQDSEIGRIDLLPAIDFFISVYTDLGLSLIHI